MYTSQPSSSSSPCVSSSSISPSSSCEVCADTVHSKQYGVAACLGCIVFFRRAIQNKSEFRCWRNGTCSITLGTRCSCRCCRLTKCFEVGMKPEAVSHRDQLGPRDPRAIPNQKTVQPHKTYSSQKVTKNDDVTAGDVNLIFKLGMRNAIKWANQFEPYRKLSGHDRKLVLSEYGIGFVLIDFAFKVSEKMGHGSVDENENEVDEIEAMQVDGACVEKTNGKFSEVIAH